MSPREQAATWGWALMLLMLLGPVLLPWYVVWVLPLAWVLPKAPRTALIAVSSLLGVTLWSTEAMRYPGAFSLNVFVGNWLVVPVIVWLLDRAAARPALTDRQRCAVRGRHRHRGAPAAAGGAAGRLSSAYPQPPARAHARVEVPIVPSGAPSRSSTKARERQHRGAERRPTRPRPRRRRRAPTTTTPARARSAAGTCARSPRGSCAARPATARRRWAPAAPATPRCWRATGPSG